LPSWWLASPVLTQVTEQPGEEGADGIAWIVAGLIGGYLASRMVNKTGEGLVRDISSALLAEL
jgi:hypothetical protein